MHRQGGWVTTGRKRHTIHWDDSVESLGGVASATAEKLAALDINALCALEMKLCEDRNALIEVFNQQKILDWEEQLEDVNEFAQAAAQTRERLSAALRNRDLLKSIGDYEENQPVEARQIREIRAIFECLGSHGYSLGPTPNREPAGLTPVFNVPPARVIRSEKVGSGCHTKLTKNPLKTGFPQLDAHGEARMNVVVGQNVPSMDSTPTRSNDDGWQLHHHPMQMFRPLSHQ